MTVIALLISVIVNAALIVWNLVAHVRHRSCRKALNRVRIERDDAICKVNGHG